MRSSGKREQFARKLEEFVQTLQPDEVSMFKEVLERGRFTESQLGHAAPGKLGTTSLAARAQRLDSAFFSRLLDW